MIDKLQGGILVSLIWSVHPSVDKDNFPAKSEISTHLPMSLFHMFMD